MKNILKITVIALFGATILFSSCKKDSVEPENPYATTYEEDDNGNITVTDKGEGTGDYTFTADKVWILNGLVFVNEGQTLTIEPGTLIKGKPGTAEKSFSVKPLNNDGE